MNTKCSLVLGAALWCSGCAAEGDAGVGVDAPVAVVHRPVVFVEAPPLVEIEPGVAVVSDYGQAVYFVDDAYWYSDGGVWYRTSHWNEPWVGVEVGAVPVTVVHRDPRAYVHYHAAASARVWHEGHERAEARVATREHEEARAHEEAEATERDHAAHQDRAMSEHVQADEHAEVSEEAVRKKVPARGVVRSRKRR